MKGGTNSNGRLNKIGTSSVGTELKPIYLNDGVPTAVSNDFVDTSSAQTIMGTKTFYSSGFSTVSIKSARSSGNIGTVNFVDKDGNTKSSLYADTNGKVIIGTVGPDGITLTGQRTYSSSNTNDVVTIGSLQSSTDVVHTTGNEVISGIKTYSNMPIIQLASYPIFSYSNTTAVIQCTSAGGSAKRIMFDVIESTGDGKASVLFTVSSGNIVTSSSKTIIGTMASTIGIVIISNLIYITVKGACTIKDLYMRYGNSRKVTANMLATPIDVSDTTTYPNQYTVEW